MTSKEIKDAIETSVRNGKIPEPKDDPAKITYSGSKLDQYGIDKMVIIRDPNNGHIITAFPENT